VSRLVTLGQLKADVANQVDITGATARHTPTLLTRQINQSITRLRERMSSEGSTVYLQSAYGTLTAGVASLFPFGLLDLSSSPTMLVKVFGLDVTISSEPRRLTPVPFDERTAYGSSIGEPVAWSEWGRTHLAVLPAPREAYPYTLWYLPAIAPLVNDADQWDGVAGWEEYVTWDVVCRVLVRDQTGKAYGMAVSARNEVWQDVLRSASRVRGPVAQSVSRDAFGERIYGMSARRTLPDP
jgi:hypothetical protein